MASAADSTPVEGKGNELDISMVPFVIREISRTKLHSSATRGCSSKTTLLSSYDAQVTRGRREENFDALGNTAGL